MPTRDFSVLLQTVFSLTQSSTFSSRLQPGELDLPNVHEDSSDPVREKMLNEGPTDRFGHESKTFEYYPVDNNNICVYKGWNVMKNI